MKFDDKDFDTTKGRADFDSGKEFWKYLHEVAKFLYKLLTWKELDD